MNLLYRLSNWKIILPLFIVYIAFPLLIFDHYQGKIDALANQEVDILDIRPSYSFEDVNTLFEAIGNEGREIYTFLLSRVDMVYPLIYTLLLILILISLLKRIVEPGSRVIYLAFLPVIGSIFDVLENVNIIGLINTFPSYTAEDVAITAMMSSSKWYSLAVVIGAIFILSLLVLRKRFRKA